MSKVNLIRYANCWEDVNNILKTLDENKTILSICSGGDNTLATLLKNPKHVVAFDTNINQIHLLKLKISAFRVLEYSEVLILLGIKKGNAYEIFLKLSDDLDKDSFEYFEKNKDYFNKGIINIGKFERYFQIFKKYICPLFASKKKIYKLATMTNIKEQEEFYVNKINNKRFNFIFNIFFGFKVMGKYGRDKSFYDYVPNKEKSAAEIKRRLDIGITTIANYNNPYINYILFNKYSEQCLPVYLRKENFDIIKNNLDKISIINGSLLDIKSRFDYFNLSDIFEYMGDEEFKSNIEHLRKISTDNSTIVYYNMQNKRYLNEDSFTYNEKMSKECLKSTKSYFYRDFLMYEKRRNKDE